MAVGRTYPIEGENDAASEEDGAIRYPTPRKAQKLRKTIPAPVAAVDLLVEVDRLELGWRSPSCS
jgi:hypothetical protein